MPRFTADSLESTKNRVTETDGSKIGKEKQSEKDKTA